MASNIEELNSYFGRIGYVIKFGQDYAYFVKIDKNTSYDILKNRILKRYVPLIQYFNLFVSWDSDIYPGKKFSVTDIISSIGEDNVNLKNIVSDLSKEGESLYDIINGVVKKFVEMGFVEMVDREAQKYEVLYGFLYLKKLVELLTIKDEENETIE